MKLKKIFYLAAAILIFAHLLVFDVSAQRSKSKRTGKTSVAAKSKVIELKAKRGVVARNGKDSNIKIDDAPNDANQKTRRPAAKGGVKTRGGGDCKIIFGNETEFRVKLYVDETYRGTVGGYDDAYLYIAPKPRTIVYARADFTDGSFLVWGPEEYECGANQFVYFKLTGGKN